jgi:hypothetical protein
LRIRKGRGDKISTWWLEGFNLSIEKSIRFKRGAKMRDKESGSCAEIPDPIVI